MQTTLAETGETLRMQAESTGAGRPLVLIGGGLTGWASWVPHAEHLADTREVVRLQLLCVQYGLEDRPLPAGYGIETESRALAAALDELAWRQPLDLVAWSFGAAAALDFALNQPERIRTLTLIEPPALWVLPDHGRALPSTRELAALLPAVDGDVSVAALERFLRTAALVPPGADPESLPQWETWVRHRRSLRSGDATFRHTDDPARLRAFTAPVLLVTGTGTSPFLRAVHDTLAEALPNARTLELAGGHAPHLAEMDAFLSRLEAFQETAAAADPGEKHVTASRDGTPIAYWGGGSGPPLLLVHGSTADHTTTWRFVLGDLRRRFTTYAMDRRGRGGSGDAPDYGLQREAEDVAAVVDAVAAATGRPVSVLGHSYGALPAIEAALLTENLDRLVLYEGVPLRGADAFEPGATNRLQALLDSGDLDGMLRAMFRDLVKMPPEEIELLRAQTDAWEVRLGNAKTLPRELEVIERYLFEPERFSGLHAPTLLLVGEHSPPAEMVSAEHIAAALPSGGVGVLPGQQHAAMYTVPHEFVEAVLRFLEAPE
jgi:pimeloyl-ACP methyl ester carboxylesterase